MVKILIPFLLIGSIFISCSDDENNDLDTICDDVVLVSADEYENAPDAHHTITSAEIVDDCLTITFGSSGCSGDSWEYKLVDADVIMESFPPKRTLRLSLENEELCEAYFVKEVSYDITALQVPEGSVYLLIDGYEPEVLYEY